MKRMYVLVGAPGSGKSTWIKEHLHTFKGYTAVISRDNIRFSLVSEEEEYFSKEKEVYNKFISDIKFSIENADNIIVDATHLNENSRAKLMHSLGKCLKNVEINAIMLKVPLERAITQNELRAGTRSYVPQTAIKRMYSQLTEPSFDEGFSKIFIIDPDREKKCLIKARG